MDSTSGVYLNPGEFDPRLLWLLRQEMQLLRFKKDFFDADYPEHAKELSESDFREMACNSIVDRLSAPPKPNGEKEW